MILFQRLVDHRFVIKEVSCVTKTTLLLFEDLKLDMEMRACLCRHDFDNGICTILEQKAKSVLSLQGEY